MIKRFFRWRHWRARAKFWRGRALKAEAALEAERYRNLEREDTLVTVPMRMAGLWGMPARSAPAEPIKQASKPPLQIAAPGDEWTWADQQEFNMYWMPPEGSDATTVRQMKERFHNEVIIPRRQPFNDDNFN